MQVRQALVAALLVVSAVGAMSQELDPGETLQGKSLAAQREQAEQAHRRASEAAAAEARNADAAPRAKAGRGRAAARRQGACGLAASRGQDPLESAVGPDALAPGAQAGRRRTGLGRSMKT